MLQNTFLHIPGIGIKSEQALWGKGIRSWKDFLAAEDIGSSKKKTERMKDLIKESQEQLQRGNVHYFADWLPHNQYWRFFPEFRDKTAYLDGFATDLDPWMHPIPVITIFDGKDITSYVRGKNLDDILEDIRKYSLIVTHSGTRIAFPFIAMNLGLVIKQVHIDLQYILPKLGYKGGLLGAEKAVGIHRKELSGLDGYGGLLLWEEYRDKKNEKALESLRAMNAYDAVSLETLMVHVYNCKLKQIPLEGIVPLPIPDYPEIPFKADIETINNLDWMSLMEKGKPYTNHPGFYYSRGLI
jgi:uncharacterized protein YprB with RNaseH-like and TPR domain